MVDETRKTKPCCCYGSNQNCMHCYGSGITEIKYIEGTNHNLLSNKENIIETPNRTNKNIICVKCKVKLAENNDICVIDKEVYCNHCFKEEAKHLIEKYSGTKHNKNTRVKTSNLDKNTSKNANVSFEIPKTFNPKNTKIQNKLVDCEYCKCKVRADRLDKHKRKVHKNNLFDKSSNENIELKTKSKTNVSNKVSNDTKNKYPESKNSYDQRNNNLQKPDYYHEKQIEKKLDYTSNYYNLYRERGRFGSHPSHDDYGEESDY